MTNQQFEVLVSNQFSYCKSLLCRKGKEYDSKTLDRLHSFKIAAELQGVTTKKALIGMLCKHTVSIYDMCADGDYSLEQWTEKITDHINYLLLLKAIVYEEKKENIK